MIRRLRALLRATQSSLVPAKSDRDVVVFGVIGVRVSPSDYMKHALDPGRLIGANGGRFHTISDPATLNVCLSNG